MAKSLPERFRGDRVSIARARKRDERDTREAIELLDAGIEIAVSLACDRGDSPALMLSAKDRDYIRRRIRFERRQRFGDDSPAIVLLWEACRSVAQRSEALDVSNAAEELLPARLKLIGERRWSEDEETRAHRDEQGTILAEAVLAFLRGEHASAFSLHASAFSLAENLEREP